MPPREYDFDAELRASNDPVVRAAATDALMEAIPGATAVSWASSENDQGGTDAWVEVRGGHLRVDVKRRTKDFGADDVALELWSVHEKHVPGWSCTPGKETDYVLWVWMDTGRYELVPFQPLVAAMKRFSRQWAKEYKSPFQKTPGRSYHSRCVFVPIPVLWAAMAECSRGVVQINGYLKKAS